MKIFRKTHFWKDNRTFIELDAEDPRIERDYPIEGNFFLKIGEQSSIKSAFKLNPDEARALRDAINMFLQVHDKKFAELMNANYDSTSYSNDYSQQRTEYPRQEPDRQQYPADDYSQSYTKKEEYSYRPDYGRDEYSKPEYTKMPIQETKPNDSFFIFGNDDAKPKAEEKKPNVEFYF